MKKVRISSIVDDSFEKGDCMNCPFSYDEDYYDEDDGWECNTHCVLGEDVDDCPIEFDESKEENMQYKIKEILHSGKKGTRNEVRTDGRYPIRIGRVVKLNEKYLQRGCPMILDYVLDENGEDYSGYCLYCSNVVNIEPKGDGILKIETLNSIYVLEEMR